MKLLLVDDERRVGDGLRRRLRRLYHDWDIRVASGGFDALEQMSEFAADAVVSDLRMPEMDGADLLSKVEENSPDIFRVSLTGHADKDLIIRASQHSHRLLAKPCEASEVASIVLEGVHLLKHLEDPSLRRFVSQIGHLPRPTEKLQLALDKLNDSNASIRSFEQLVDSEPVIVAGIMRVANTPFFGSGNVGSIFEAVQSLGLATLQAILVAELARQSVQLPASCKTLLGRVIAGSHESMNSCLNLYRLAWKNKISRGDAITACLLQDIGKLVFLSVYPEAYRSLIADCDRTHKNVIQFERERFGCDHAQLGGFLLHLWGLPESIVAAVALHHHLGYVSSNSGSLPGLLFLGGQHAMNHAEKSDPFFFYLEEKEVISGIAPDLVDQIFREGR